MSQSTDPGNSKVKDVLKILGIEKNNVVSGKTTDDIFTKLSSKKEDGEVPLFRDNILLKNRDQAQFHNFSEAEFEENAKIVHANYQRTNNIRNTIATPSSMKENVPKLSSSFPKPNYENYKGKTPVQMFELFFDVVIVNYILSKLLIEKQGYLFPITPKHIKQFLGILLLSGYNKTSKPPGCYWEHSDVRNELVAKSMDPERFLYIIDTCITTNLDSLRFSSFLMYLFRKRFAVFLPPEEVISYNECILDSFPRPDCREMRHVPFGYRVSCLNTPSGYLVNFYTHEKCTKKCDYEKKFGEAATPLLEMLDDLHDKIRNLPYKIYFGNLNTDTSFLHEIKRRGYTPVGIFSNRQLLKEFRHINHTTSKFNSFPQGYYDVCKNMLIANIDSNFDYKIVTALCNKTNDPPIVLQNCARMLVNNYKESIIGTDTMNKHIELYKTEIFNRKKLFWTVFSWLLDVSVNNAWLLMKKAGNDISQLDFRRSIVRAYLDEYCDAPAKL